MSRPSTTAPEAGTTRRGLLKIAALLGGSALSGKLAWAIGPGRPDFAGAETIYRGNYPLDRAENVVTSTCLGCHGGCPTRASREVGVVAKLDGNPFSSRVYPGRPPANAAAAAKLRGALCARGQARLQNTHDPHRIVLPLFRDGPRGGGRWRAGDSAALEAWFSAVDGPALRGRVVVAADPRQADRQAVLGAFAGMLPRAEAHLGHPAPWLVRATENLLGKPGYLCVPRWNDTTALLAWGADPLASGLDPVGDAAALLRRRSLFHRRAVVVVDPRLSETAAKADLWLPVRPGGDLALAWQMLRAFVEDGVTQPPAGWADALLAYPLAELENQSGIGREMARRAAGILAEAGRGLAIRVGGGVGERAGGHDTSTAILRLAAILGATGSGGAMAPTPLPPVLGERPADALYRVLVKERGVIDTLVLVGDAGLADAPVREAVLAAIADPQRVRHVVAFATAMDPVNFRADVIVPDVTEHERDGLVVRHDGISLVRPVVPSILAETGVPDPWSRGLDGALEWLASRTGAALDTAAVVAEATVATGESAALQLRGWVPSPLASSPPPSSDHWARPLEHALARATDDLSLVTWRESFGGHVDSLAQYWCTPSFREENVAWIHPRTAEALGLAYEEHRHHDPHPEAVLLVRLSRDDTSLVARVRVTESIRAGAVGLALGWGHVEGYDGNTWIDGEVVPGDGRRARGVAAARLLRPDGVVNVEARGARPPPTLLELLAAPDGTCNRT